MKSFLSILIFSILAVGCTTSKNTSAESLPTADSSKTSLDWKGVYSAIQPFTQGSENLDSVRLTIYLLDEQNYISETTLMKMGSKPIATQGKFSWNKEGSHITLKPDNAKVTTSYQVGENVLMALNEKGERKSEEYFLQKLDTELTNKYWKVTELSGVKIVWQHENQREPHIIFRDEEKRFSGNSGCNSFSGSYQLLTGNKIMLGSAMATKMYCEGAMAIEDQLFQLFEKVDGYSVLGDDFILYDKEMKVLAKFEAVYF